MSQETNEQVHLPPTIRVNIHATDSYEDEIYIREPSPSFEWRISSDENDIKYAFHTQNHFLYHNGHKDPIFKAHKKIINGFNLSYYQCHVYIVDRFISTHYTFIPDSIKNICINFLANPCLFDVGIAVMNNHNLNTAILIFEAYLQLNSTESINNKGMISDAWRYLGKSLAENENEKNGIIAFHKCLELNPNDLQSLLNIGIAYINESQNDKALEYLELFLHKHSEYKIVFELDKIDGINEFHYGIGRLTLLFKEALKCNENDIDVRVVLGILYNLQSDFVQSSYQIYKCIELKPNDASLWNKYGATKAKKGDYDDAIVAYKTALQLQPNYVRVYANLAIAYSNCDKFEQAIKCDLMSLAINPLADNDIWEHLETCLLYYGALDLIQLCVVHDIDSLKKHFDLEEALL